MKQGVVIKSTGSNYLLQSGADRILCKIRGKFRTKEFMTTNPVAVGDIVYFTMQKDEDFGIISKIKERKNFLVRKSTNLSRQTHIIAANIDYAFLMITLIQPKTYLMFVDRWLAACENSNIVPVLLFNKIDLYNAELSKKLESIINMYADIGYKCIKMSVPNNLGIDEVKDTISAKVVVLSGNSGVGKSSLINRLNPDLDLKTGEISEFHEQGKHTTTFAEMFPIAGGFIIDTPGIKGFGLDETIKEHLGDCFIEIKAAAEKCKFNNCTHTHEPECAVKQAVKSGKIHSERYRNYIAILNENDAKYRQDNYL